MAKRILHIVNETSPEASSLECCLRVLAMPDAVLFIENGVYNVLMNSTGAKLLEDYKNRMYCLLPDLQARGYVECDVVSGADIIGYREFVGLAVEFDTVLSW